MIRCLYMCFLIGHYLWSAATLFCLLQAFVCPKASFHGNLLLPFVDELLHCSMFSTGWPCSSVHRLREHNLSESDLSVDLNSCPLESRHPKTFVNTAIKTCYQKNHCCTFPHLLVATVVGSCLMHYRSLVQGQHIFLNKWILLSKDALSWLKTTVILRNIKLR